MRYGQGVLLVVLAGLLWSVQGLIFRQIYEAGPWVVLFWRSVGMAPVLLGFLIWRSGGAPLAAIRQAGLAGALGGLSLIVTFGGNIYAIQTTTVANALFLYAAAPFLTALLGWAVLRERVAGRTWAAMAVAFVGILVMVREGLAGGAIAGDAAALLCALGFAVFTVCLRWHKVADTLPSVLLGAVFSIAAGALVTSHLGQTLAAPAPDALWSAFMGAVTLSGGLILYTLGSKVVPAAELALLSEVEVVLAPVWVWLVLGETASAGTLFSGLTILCAVLMNALSGARQLARA